MAKSLNKREQAAALAKLDHRKTKLMAVPGVDILAAFDRVRLLHDQEHKTWLEAYDIVIAEVEAAAAPEEEEGGVI